MKSRAGPWQASSDAGTSDVSHAEGTKFTKAFQPSRPCGKTTLPSNGKGSGIAEGIGLGLIAYAVLHLATGARNRRRRSPTSSP
jgi:hypothetical protein